MAAVTPQTILCGIERLSPAGTFVEAATSPSRWDVRGNRVKCGATINAKNGLLKRKKKL
jgi:hypothetical protein